MENIKNYDKDYPPINCNCGYEITEMKNKEFQGDLVVEYNLHCKKCGKYLGHFAYGNWEY